MSENLTQDPVSNDVEPDETALETTVEHDALSAEHDETTPVADEAESTGDEGVESEDSAPEAPAGGAPQSRHGQLEREGEVAADFLETLLDICDLDGDLEVDIDGDRAAVSIVDSEDGRVPRRLVGQNGQVLDALQELTRLAVQSATGERSRLMLDVGGHRAERRATLVTVAKEAIDEVRTTGERKPLTPMTAFERKVVHDEVLAAGLMSESEGAEPRRYVVILPA
jgi:spoIIIJ-associated protein